LLAASVAAAAGPPLEQARKLLLGGKYAEAAEIYGPLAAKEPAAALGLARALEANGKTDRAVGTLKVLAEKRPELQAELARLAFERGDLKEAAARVRAALALDDQQLLARWIAAELDRAEGRLEKADRGYHWLVEFYNNHDVKRAESLRWIGLAAAQYARWNRLWDQFEFLVNELYPEALKLDPAYWPAHFEAGMLFLEKFNEADAAREFKAALELNPQAAEVHAALAALALENHNFEEAEQSLGRALEINPRLLPAQQIEADLAWLNLEVPETLRFLEGKVLPLNPVDEETLGRIAACRALLEEKPREGGASRLQRLIAEVTGRNPHAGNFFSALAGLLQERNKQAEAEAYFREAIRVMPRLPGAQADLGLLYMRMGREEDARRLLKEAFQSDPFHVRVKNNLDVLDVLDTLAVVRSPHFVVKYDGKADKQLGRYVVRHVEAVYPELCKLFGYQPPGRPLIEIFNAAQGLDGHQWFSARMIGMPYLDTVAASTGCLVAMASPNDSGGAARFNWARVLKHELVHVITLQQTKFNIPHWYTEGLAVWCEAYPRPQPWNELLTDRLARGKLFNLQTLNAGFARPGGNDQCQLAYCQAELYVEYMLTRGGPQRQRQLLAAYADNLSTAAAIRLVFGVSPEEFERGYLAYVQRLAAGLSAMKRPSRAGFAAVLKAHRDRPGDADAAAEAAYAHLCRGDNHQALDLARKALALRPRQPLATCVAARLRAAEGKEDEAAAMLEAALDRRAPESVLLQMLAELKLKAKQYDAAAELYALGERLEPGNPKWTAALARVYQAAERPKALADTLARLTRIDSDDAAARKKLAGIALAGKDYAAAAQWANQALEIDVNDAEVHRLLAQALVSQGKYAPGIEEYGIAVELDPSGAEARFALAAAYVHEHQPVKAREALEALLKRAPDYPGARALLESLQAPESEKK
jgi:tetratricopeptide (TPR) repeat protein